MRRRWRIRNSAGWIAIKALLLFFFVMLQPVGALAAEWHEVTDTSLVVSEGSPLDFSRWLPSGPAGAHGRIVISRQGRLAFENRPGEPARLHCASLAWSPATGGFPDHDTARLYARQLRIHGYNLVRLHYVEALLMSDRSHDFDFDPEQLDRFHYFLFALKEEGIYWLVDAMSSENGAIGDVRPHRWIRKHDLKFRVHVDATAQKHWRDLVDKLYAAVNPYTGLSILRDPALAGVILLNEGGMNLHALTGPGMWDTRLQAPFEEWLRRHYRDGAVPARAWGASQAGGKEVGLEAATLPEALRAASPRMTAFQRFLTELESDTARWMSAHLRARGYAGPISSYNNWASGQADATRASLNWVDMHAYHDESVSFAPGTSIMQTSSLGDTAQYVRWLAGTRQSGKPFSVTEYGQPFWNRFRFEAGAVVPAMAAFQGWDFVCLHAEGAIDLSLLATVERKAAIHPYGVGIDPVARAGETLAALLFMRADVAPARHRLCFKYTEQTIFKDSGLLAMQDDLNSLAWLTGIELSYRSRPETPREWQDLAGGRGAVKDRVNNCLRLSISPSTLGERVDVLRKTGVLDAGNETNVTAGRMVSDTGQIDMDTSNRRFIVRSPRTEAITVAGPTGALAIGILRIASISGPALLSASALDDQPLSHSKKILLVFATNAENTGMQFEDSERRQLKDLGSLPPRIEEGVADIVLALAHDQPMQLISLKLNGERGSRIPISRSAKEWALSLNNALRGEGPTTFFLFEAE